MLEYVTSGTPTTISITVAIRESGSMRSKIAMRKSSKKLSELIIVTENTSNKCH